MNISSLLERHGRCVELYAADGAPLEGAWAIISPLRYKNKMYLYGVNTEIGYNNQGHYLYIGPPQPDLTKAEDGEYLQADEIKYRIDRAEKVYAGNEVLYIWAVVRMIVEI